MLRKLERLGISPEQLSEITAYCNSVDPADEENTLGFEYRGQFIINIFASPCMRYKYDISKAMEVYGEPAVRDFCKRVLRKIGRMRTSWIWTKFVN